MVAYRVVVASVMLLSLIGCQTMSGGAYNSNGPTTPQAAGFMPVGQQVVAPLGYLIFCKESPQECAPADRRVSREEPVATTATISIYPTATTSAPLVSMSASAGSDEVDTDAADWKMAGPTIPRARPARRSLVNVVADARAAQNLTPALLAATTPPVNDNMGAGSTKADVPFFLSASRWAQLTAINSQVNDRVRAVRDDVLYERPEWWAYPTNNAGDCEDYVLAKRKLLIASGWPTSSLLITVAKQWNGEGHAVLVVVTDQGEFVLDNMQRYVVSWRDAPYQWVMRQSQVDPNIWVNLDPAKMRAPTSRPTTVATLERPRGRT